MAIYGPPHCISNKRATKTGRSLVMRSECKTLTWSIVSALPTRLRLVVGSGSLSLISETEPSILRQHAVESSPAYAELLRGQFLSGRRRTVAGYGLLHHSFLQLANRGFEVAGGKTGGITAGR